MILDDYSRSVPLGSIVGRGPVGRYWSLNLSSIHCFICLVLSKSLYAGNCQSSQEYNHIIILSSGYWQSLYEKGIKKTLRGIKSFYYELQYWHITIINPVKSIWFNCLQKFCMDGNELHLFNALLDSIV